MTEVSHQNDTPPPTFAGTTPPQGAADLEFHNPLQRWLFAPAPSERLAVLRILTGSYAVIYLLARLPHHLSYRTMTAASFRPIGLLSGLDAPLSHGLVIALTLATTALSLPFLLGFAHRRLAPSFACLLLVLLTYINCFGKILHTDNLLVLHVIILAVAPSANTLSWDAQRNARRGHQATAPSHGRYQWPVRALCLAAVAAYLLAGIVKLRLGGLGFIEGATLRNFVAYDNVRKLELGSIHSPLGAALLPYAEAFTVLAWASLALELGAPVALLHRKLGQSWALAMWGFHVGVLALMAIVFAYPLTVGLACFFPVERCLRTRVGTRFFRWYTERLNPMRGT